MWRGALQYEEGEVARLEEAGVSARLVLIARFAPWTLIEMRHGSSHTQAFIFSFSVRNGSKVGYIIRRNPPLSRTLPTVLPTVGPWDYPLTVYSTNPLALDGGSFFSVRVTSFFSARVVNLTQGNSRNEATTFISS